MPDFTFKQGDTGPTLTDTLTYSDGSPVNLAGANVAFQLRSLTSSQPLTLTGPTTVTSFQGGVAYTPSAADTAHPGGVMGNWQATLAGGQVLTFPTQGYLWGVIEPSISAEPQALVSLPAVKDYLNRYGIDRTHDAKLLNFIYAATPVIEDVVGPVIIRTFEEWHDGGQYWIKLRRRPSSAIGSNPVLTIIGCDEYRGPIKYTLSQIADPSAASIYSVMLDPKLGTLYRRTTGGGVIPFGAGPWGGGMPQAVHVVYQAGQLTVPANVHAATLETIRVNYEQTMPTGTGSRSIADDDDRGTPLGYFLPRHCLELLAPMRRHPAIA